MMDNASTHYSDRVEELIADAGALLIYGPPFSPHINPIELYFGKYKAYIKKNDKRMVTNWYEVHREALTIVDRDMGIKFFRKSKVPGSNMVLTTEEMNNTNV